MIPTGLRLTGMEMSSFQRLAPMRTSDFTQEDFEDIRNNLASWENDFIRKVGVSYDESDFDRGI